MFGRVSAPGMSDNLDYHRAIAAYCERMFRDARTMDMKTAWLRLAMKWRALIPEPIQPDSSEGVPQPTGPAEPAK